GDAADLGHGVAGQCLDVERPGGLGGRRFYPAVRLVTGARRIGLLTSGTMDIRARRVTFVRVAFPRNHTPASRATCVRGAGKIGRIISKRMITEPLAVSARPAGSPPGSDGNSPTGITTGPQESIWSLGFSTNRVYRA